LTDFVLSQKITEKLAARGITLDHILECFDNRTGEFLADERNKHKTDPLTQWFISRTHPPKPRVLKIAFMNYASSHEIHIKSSYDPNEEEIRIYNKYGQPTDPF
jgi:hypothetical protein